MLNTARYWASVFMICVLFVQPSQAAPPLTRMKDAGFGSPKAWKPAPCDLTIQFAGKCSFRAVDSVRAEGIRHWGKDSFVPIALYCPHENSGKLVLISIDNDQLIEAMEVRYINGRAINAKLFASEDKGREWDLIFIATLPYIESLSRDDRDTANGIIQRADFFKSNIC